MIHTVPNLSGYRPRVLDLHNQNVAGANVSELVHSRSDPFPFHHNLYGDPAFFFQGVNRGSTFSGRDFTGCLQLGTLDIECAKHVLLGGYILSDPDSSISAAKTYLSLLEFLKQSARPI
jgi:hypothetical protein